MKNQFKTNLILRNPAPSEGACLQQKLMDKAEGGEQRKAECCLSSEVAVMTPANLFPSWAKFLVPFLKLVRNEYSDCSHKITKSCHLWSM